MKIEVWGKYALFTRPELKAERMSYDVMTPSAARGLLDAILWHPGMKWVIDRIYVLNPIKFVNMRGNEVGAPLNSNAVKRVLKGNPEKLYLCAADNIQQRTNRLLRDVRYVIEAHIEMTSNAHPGDTVKKFSAMAQGREGSVLSPALLRYPQIPRTLSPLAGRTGDSDGLSEQRYRPRPDAV